MSAANYALNVDKLTQVGGALNLLNADGSVNVAGTTALVTQLQQQLGSNFSQSTVADALHTQFVQQGGVPSWFGVVAIAAAIVVSVLTYGAASGAVGAAAGATAGSTFAAATAATATSAAVSAGLGNIIVSAAIAGIASSATSQLITTGSIDAGKLGEAGLVSGITAGLLNGITYSSADGLDFTTGTTVVGGSGPQSLASLAGLQNLSNAMSPSASGTGASVSTQLVAVAGGAAISAGVQTVVEGGSYLGALKGSLVSSAAAIGAYEIGELSQPGAVLEQGSAAYVLAHAALGCAAGAASGTGCEGGALGGATSAIITPLLVNAAGGAASLTSTQREEIVGLATLLGGTNALLTGVNAVGGATSAENEALNNSTLDHESEFDKEREELKKQTDAAKAALGEATLVQKDGGVAVSATSLAMGLSGVKASTTSGTSPSTNSLPANTSQLARIFRDAGGAPI